MFGLIGRFSAKEGQRPQLLAALLEGIETMPGCLSYVVAADPADENAVWITEVWEDEESHKASLQLPQVKAAIERAMPLIASFGDHVTTIPLGGLGIPRPPTAR